MKANVKSSERALPLLVNRRYPVLKRIDKSGLATFAHAGFSVQLDAKAAHMLSALMDEVNGWEQIVAISGYRSRSEQRFIYEQSMQDNGLDFTRKFVALPGHSEHETGLAVDMALIVDNIDPLTPYFPYEGICQCFRRRAADFGFIQRYPAGKENITGIAHEPWHFRYVGLPHSVVMGGLTLEEYVLGEGW